MIVLSNEFDRLDDYIADAALGNISWSQSLELMSPLAGADGMSMDLVFGHNRAVTSLGSYGFDQEMVEAYSDHYHSIDPRMAFVQSIPGHGVIFDEEMSPSDTRHQNSEFWQWLEQSNAPSDAAALVMPCIGDVRIVLAVHRNSARKSDPASSAGIVAFFNKFYDKLRAVNAMIRLSHPDRIGRVASAFPLHNIDCFDFHVDETLVVEHTDAMLRYRLPLTGLARLDDDNRLVMVSGEFNMALQGLLQGNTPGSDGQFTVKTAISDGIVSLSAVAGPTGTKSAKVSVTFLRHNSEIEKVFMGAFSLTRRQAELLQALRTMYSLGEAAKAMSISRNTARVFLGQIYDRTGVRRKSELLRLADRFA